MAARDDILNRVTAQPAAAADDALLKAVDLSDPQDQVALVGTILTRGQPRGLTGLIARLHDLPDEVQSVVVARAGELAGGLRAALTADIRQTRVNGLRLVSTSRLAPLAGGAVVGLSDVDEHLVDEAATALAHCVQQYLAEPRPARPSENDTVAERKARSAWADGRDKLLAAVRAAVLSFQTHRRLAVLDAAVRLADELADTILTLLNQPGNPITQAMVELVTQSLQLGRAGVGFYYLALASPETRIRFAGRIGALSDRALIGEMIAQSHRANDPEVAKGLAAVRQFTLFSRPAWWEQLPDDVSTALARWIMAIGVDGQTKADWLVQLTANGSAEQRDAAIDTLCRWPDQSATDALQRIVQSSNDAELTERAAAELARRGAAELPGLLRDRLADPDPQIRGLAIEHVGRTTFERFWSHYPKLPNEVREFAAGKLRRVVPDLVDRLAAMLLDDDPAQRLQALRVVDQAGLAGSLAEHIHACCADADSRVRSAAVKLLGEAGGADSSELAKAALADPDARVRANAVEALERSGAESASPQLADMLDDSDNRIRANAIKALLGMNLAAARDSLLEMLKDGSVDHRLSALWVVQQSGWLKPAEQVLHLARHDPDRRVRRGALRALSELRRAYRTIVRPGATAGRQRPASPAST